MYGSSWAKATFFRYMFELHNLDCCVDNQPCCALPCTVRTRYAMCGWDVCVCVYLPPCVFCLCFVCLFGDACTEQHSRFGAAYSGLRNRAYTHRTGCPKLPPVTRDTMNQPNLSRGLRSSGEHAGLVDCRWIRSAGGMNLEGLDPGGGASPAGWNATHQGIESRGFPRRIEQGRMPRNSHPWGYDPQRSSIPQAGEDPEGIDPPGIESLGMLSPWGSKPEGFDAPSRRQASRCAECRGPGGRRGSRDPGGHKTRLRIRSCTCWRREDGYKPRRAALTL